jgi:hypothetical protein
MDDNQEIKKHPVWGYETLEDLRCAFRQTKNIRYQGFTDAEIDQMTLPWFVADKKHRKIQLLYGADSITGFEPNYLFFYLSPEDKERIKRSLDQIRRIAVEREGSEDNGQEPTRGYDEDLGVMRRIIIMRKGLPDTLWERFVFSWVKLRIKTPEFQDPWTGVSYDSRSVVVPGSEDALLHKAREYEAEIAEYKKNPPKPGFIEVFIKPLSGI